MDEGTDRAARGRIARTHADVLLVLRRDGPLSLDDLVTRLGTSRLATLRELRDLAGAGLVTRRPDRHGVGRPRHLYEASPMGEGTIPGEYEAVAASLLDATRDVGGHVLLAKVFDARGHALARQFRESLDRRGLTASPLVDRAREFATAQDELGYACELVVDADVVRLQQFNCPVYSLVERSQAICEAELAMTAELLRASVARESHIPAGGRCCTFRIEPRLWDATQMAVLPATTVVQPSPSTTGWSGSQMRPATRGEAGTPAKADPETHSRSWTSRQVAWPRPRGVEAAEAPPPPRRPRVP